MGRPTKYKKEFCEKIIKLGEQGKSVVQIAANFSVHKDSIYEWCKKYPEFSDSFRVARTKSEAYWVAIYQDKIINNEPVNAALIKLIMVNCYQWRSEAKEEEAKHETPVVNIIMPKKDG